MTTDNKTENKNGLILAIDSASTACSVCVAKNGNILSSIFINNKLTHSQTLLPSVERVLSLSGISVNDLDHIAVTTGPGSFTGVKIAVSTVKGLAYAKNIPCIAVSSQEALAYNLIGINGLICTVMDARRNQFYNALFQCENGKIKRLREDRQISAEALLNDLQGINDLPVFLTGDGTFLLYEYLKNNSFNAICAPETLIYIKAESIILAVNAGMGTLIDQEELIPIYLRPPQAERELLEKQKNI
jgi:tRNA threonylcarbamoyladenosine biosynthesis protein TsaB